MKRLFVAFACLILFSAVSAAQKGKADPDYYPIGYSGDTWTGEVTAFDNDQRTLTLTYVKDKKVSTFVASVPDAPYEWGNDARNFRVVDFPYDKEGKVQLYTYVGAMNSAGYVMQSGPTKATQRRPNPPAENVIDDLAQFVTSKVTVYYTIRERKVDGKTEKYNDVWRIRMLPPKKK
jgi:hypothetical protein